MNLRTVRTYQGSQTIGCDDSTDLYHCMNGTEQMLKRDGKPAAYKNLTLAEKFMMQQGLQEVLPEKKSTIWTPPVAAVIAPLEEQLTKAPQDERFVLIEKSYSATYHELGYAVYDREEEEVVMSRTFNGRNDTTTDKAEAEKELAYCKEHGAPPKVKMNMDIFNAMVRAEEAYENRFVEPLPEPEVVPVTEDEISIESEQVVGSIITYHGDRWLVKDCSYLSAKEAAELEDGFDIFISAGWHSDLVRIKKEVRPHGSQA